MAKDCEIFNRVKAVIENICESIDISDETRIEELGIDSIAYLRIIVDLEEAFGFEFEDEKLVSDAFTTIGDINNYIRNVRKKYNE